MPIQSKLLITPSFEASQKLDSPLYIGEKKAALRYDMSVAWFQRKRWEGGGPPFVKLSGRVLYPVADTDTWFAERLVTSTSDVSAKA